MIVLPNHATRPATKGIAITVNPVVTHGKRIGLDGSPMPELRPELFAVITAATGRNPVGMANRQPPRASSAAFHPATLPTVPGLAPIASNTSRSSRASAADSARLIATTNRVSSSAPPIVIVRISAHGRGSGTYSNWIDVWTCGSRVNGSKE